MYWMYRSLITGKTFFIVDGRVLDREWILAPGARYFFDRFLFFSSLFPEKLNKKSERKLSAISLRRAYKFLPRKMNDRPVFYVLVLYILLYMYTIRTRKITSKKVETSFVFFLFCFFFFCKLRTSTSAFETRSRIMVRAFGHVQAPCRTCSQRLNCRILNKLCLLDVKYFCTRTIINFSNANNVKIF